jgi:hypothetical protein
MFGLLVILAICGWLASWIATEKLRRGAEGFFVGFFLGPFGVLVEALLPAGAPAAPPAREIEERKRREPLTEIVAEKELELENESRKAIEGARRWRIAAIARREAEELERQLVADELEWRGREARRAARIKANGGYTDWQLIGIGVLITVPVVALWLLLVTHLK